MIGVGHRVDKLPVVGEVRVGLSWSLGRVEITLAQTLRSREFRGQIAPDRYGWVGIAYRP